MKVYFDNAATTKLNKEVLTKMLPYLEEFYGNPSSIHSNGRKTRVAIEAAREFAASSINAHPSEIYFTSGGTEANNFAIFGISKEEFNESKRTKIISSLSEHHCVLDACNELRKSQFQIELLSPDSNFVIDKDSIINKLDTNTFLVSIMHVNNEVGTINSIQNICSGVKSANAFFHTDAVQSFGKIKIDVKELGVDSLSISGHKIGGPKGVGFTYVKSGTPISSLIIGGSQERNRRGGTENTPAIVGLAESIRISQSGMDENFEKVTSIKKRFVDNLTSSKIEHLKINGQGNSIPHILSVTFSSEYYNNDSEAMLMLLDINGIAASNGAACASGTLKPSHVIMSAGYSKEDAAGTIRFSFSTDNSFEEVDYCSEVLERIAEKFKK